ncbi:MAG: SGNH/GDSL hydrolase family protein [Anaerolineae bacterium]|nr:SGNH/GDSL hydrolase family protein [Anaerolineae bacterium]
MTLDTIRQRLQSEPRTRIVAFGSSNTERRIHGLHWFDWLDLGIKHTYGRVHHFINTGIGGDTTRGLLDRFDEDVARYEPHAVFVTIGGNDSNPDAGIDAATYRANLLTLCEGIRALAAVPILQTYYAADVEDLGPVQGPRFLQYMQIVRDVSAETDSPLVDHHRRWEPLRLQHPDLYQALMLDALHVNALGNMVMGMDLLRAFDVRLDAATHTYCVRGRGYQTVLDSLESA